MKSGALYNLKLIFEMEHLYGARPYNLNNLYDTLYDKLIEDGHKIDFSTDQKESMWNESLKRMKSSIYLGRKIKDQKEERIKHYKSILVKKYLMDVYKTTGQKLILFDENDKEKKPLRLVKY